MIKYRIKFIKSSSNLDGKYLSKNGIINCCKYTAYTMPFWVAENVVMNLNRVTKKCCYKVERVEED